MPGIIRKMLHEKNLKMEIPWHYQRLPEWGCRGEGCHHSDGLCGADGHLVRGLQQILCRGLHKWPPWGAVPRCKPRALPAHYPLSYAVPYLSYAAPYLFYAAPFWAKLHQLHPLWATLHLWKCINWKGRIRDFFLKNWCTSTQWLLAEMKDFTERWFPTSAIWYVFIKGWGAEILMNTDLILSWENPLSFPASLCTGNWEPNCQQRTNNSLRHWKNR